MEGEGSPENKIDDDGDDTIDVVIELSDITDGSSNQILKVDVTEGFNKAKEIKDAETAVTVEKDCHKNKEDEEEIKVDSEMKADLDREEEEKPENFDSDKKKDFMENLEKEMEVRNESILNMKDNHKKSFEDKKEVDTEENEFSVEEKKDSMGSFVGEKVDNENDEEKDAKELVIDEKIGNEDDIKEKDLQKITNEDDNSDKKKVTEELNKKVVEEKFDDKEETEEAPKEEEKCNESISKELDENKKADNINMNIEHIRDTKENKEENKVEESSLTKENKVGESHLTKENKVGESSLTKENKVEESSLTKENKVEESSLTKETEEKKEDSVVEKEDMESNSKKDGEEKQDSDIPENIEKKDSGEKPAEEIPEELQMEVDDDDRHSDELPDQINFVDVNAPPPCESPLLIDDDDDDDEIICMVDKGKTSTKPQKRNRRKTGRDSSPEILQEDINKKRREIVIDLDDDDDDIEIETIKTRKKRNRTGGLKGISCCNIECPNQDEDLRRAPVFVLTYYGRKYKKGRIDKVCGQCYEEAMQHQEHLSYLLSEHKPLFSAEFRAKNDTVVLTDSDEEASYDDECVPDEVLEDLQSKLQEVLDTTVEKYDLNYQIQESQDMLTKKFEKLTAEFKETDDLLNQLQKKMDQLRYDVYKDYTPKIRELPALTIDDRHCGLKEPVIRMSPPRAGNQLLKPQQQFIRQQHQQKQPIIQNRISVAPSAQSPQKQRYASVHSYPSTSSQDTFRKSPLGVATKKVTQIQRSLGPSQPEMEKRSNTDVRSHRVEDVDDSSPSLSFEEDGLLITNADHLASEPDPVDRELLGSPDSLQDEIRNSAKIISPGNLNSLCISPDLSPFPMHLSCCNLIQRQEDVVALEQVEVNHKPLPPIGSLTRPKPHAGDIMYVMKLSFYGVWSRAKVLEVVPKGTELSSGSLSMYNMYKVKFESSYRKSNPVKQVTGKQMAYTTPSPVRFPVGTRVIAIFQDNDWSKECYYSGVIAEPPKSMNNYRYLVFFDDGYAQYVSHEKILLVCESSRNVWEDIHPDSREFIRKYLEQYPERPMVKLQQGQIVKTEWNGKWWIARVVDVDGSLVKMHFDADGRTEWIYRGSTRLGPLYAELAHAAARKEQGTFSRHRGLGVASLKKRNMPYVEYTRGTEGEELRREDSGVTITLLGPVRADGHMSESAPARAVAKKSTTKRPDSMERGHEQNIAHSAMDKSQKPQGRVEYLQLNTSKRPRRFEPHQCGPNCLLGSEYDPKAMRGMNPLVVPMLCSWERQVNRCRGKRLVIYRAPCGRRLRNMEELHRYLRITKSNMAVDLFDFDFWVHCFAEFVLEKGFSNIKDLSYGAEYVPVPCVNCVDRSLPDFVKYSTKREPTDGVHLNLETEFLTGCDCTDDCQDRDKCACWQLTIQGTAYGPGGVVDPTVGYIYRRLPEPVMTGIYECNSRCKCSNTCLNRVAQQPLQLKLQVFKTENRGWGIRCLNDIPQGGFICIYAGRLLTEQGANEGGKNYGDEYLAELDYIEVVEKLKEGYESDVVDDDDSDSPYEEKGTSEARKTKVTHVRPESSASEDEEEEAENSQDTRDSDEEYQLTHWSKQKSVSTFEQNSIRTRLRNRSSRHGSEDSQTDGKDKDKDRDDRDSDRASSDGRDSRRGEGHKKNPRSISSSDHNYSDDEDSELLRQPSRFAVVSEPKESEKNKKPKYRSVREFFGLDEYCYIMDAKTIGNIGRYLNHSCSPNVFVQNVFVDTHDLRFPWVAFFALTYIHAGTELTWDYNYDVGSVPGKVLHCYCGSNDCRGRLL